MFRLLAVGHQIYQTVPLRFSPCEMTFHRLVQLSSHRHTLTKAINIVFFSLFFSPLLVASGDFFFTKREVSFLNGKDSGGVAKTGMSEVRMLKWSAIFINMYHVHCTRCPEQRLIDQWDSKNKNTVYIIRQPVQNPFSRSEFIIYSKWNGSIESKQHVEFCIEIEKNHGHSNVYFSMRGSWLLSWLLGNSISYKC